MFRRCAVASFVTLASSIACSESSLVETAKDSGADGLGFDRLGEEGSGSEDGEGDAEVHDTSATSEATDHAAIDGSPGTIDLFNGADLTGWDKFLGPPYGLTEPIGLNTDPKNVFSVVVVDGAPAIRVSGEIWGGLTTVETYENYHLTVEFKWGTHEVWPPLTGRDSGLLYHSVGSFGAVSRGGPAVVAPVGSGHFMISMEMQIAVGDVGSYYSLGPITVDGGAYSSAAAAQHENPDGQWNTLEIFAVGNESVHVVNGKVATHVMQAMYDDGVNGPVTLKRGKIQLQSESMEIFFRTITLAPIEKIPLESL